MILRASKTTILVVLGLALVSCVHNARERKIPQSEATSVWGYYGVTPESPDGKRLCYALYPEPIDLTRNEKYAVYPAQLWVCDIDGTGHRMLFDKGSGSVHNGLMQNWLDDNRIVFLSDGATRIINADTGKIEFGPWKDLQAGHYARDGKILLRTITDAASPSLGIHEFDAASGKIRLVLPYSKRIGHMQYSPDGRKVLFKTEHDFLAVANLDGSDIRIHYGKKPMHVQWFDDKSFFGYAQPGVVGVDLKKHNKHELYRWNLDGEIIEYLAGHGCHGTGRKDGKYFAGESWYGSNPIELRLYARGSRESLRKIFSHSFVQVTWRNGGRHHVNPSFSRDGMRLYYNKAVNENTSHAFSYDLTGLVSSMERVGERNNQEP